MNVKRLIIARDDFTSTNKIVFLVEKLYALCKNVIEMTPHF